MFCQEYCEIQQRQMGGPVPREGQLQAPIHAGGQKATWQKRSWGPSGRKRHHEPEMGLPGKEGQQPYGIH